MSFNGVIEFDKNLRKVMDSDAFKNAGDGVKLRIGATLLNSKYGFGSFFGFGSVKPFNNKRGRGMNGLHTINTLLGFKEVEALPCSPRQIEEKKMKQYGIYNIKYGYWAFDSKYDVFVFENINIARAQAEALRQKHILDDVEVREFPEDEE